MNDVRVVFSKWGGLAHYEYDAQRLGEDEHGVWLGLAVGTVVARPGASFVTGEPQVVLVPRVADYVATFYGSGGTVPCSTYVDVTTTPTWDGRTLRVVDLDLDVVKGWSGRVWVEDEDEFARHRTCLGYPDHVVEAALCSCEAVRQAVEERNGPFDGAVADRWMGELGLAMMRS